MKDKLFCIAPLTLQHGQEICSWKYESPYDIYNWNSWDKMMKEQEEFADPAIRRQQYSAVLDDDGMLCGFAQFFPLNHGLRLGLGMRPDLCGQGLGEAFMKVIVEEAIMRNSRAAADKDSREIDLEVLVWNKRAFKLYAKSGFAMTDRYVRNTPTGPAEFYCMVYRPSDPV